MACFALLPDGAWQTLLPLRAPPKRAATGKEESKAKEGLSSCKTNAWEILISWREGGGKDALAVAIVAAEVQLTDYSCSHGVIVPFFFRVARRIG